VRKEAGIAQRREGAKKDKRKDMSHAETQRAQRKIGLFSFIRK